MNTSHIKGFMIGGMLCGMMVLTGCSVSDTLGLLIGSQKKQESEQTEVNQSAYIVDDSVQKPDITKNLGGEELLYTCGKTADALSVICQVSDAGTLSYQWYRNNVDSNGGGSVIEGAVSSSYVPSTQEVGTVFYYVVITNRIDDRIQLVTSATQKVTVEENLLEAVTQ